MQIIKRPFRDIGSLIRSRGGNRSKQPEGRVDNLRERFTATNRGPRPLNTDDLAAGIAGGELFLEYQPRLDWRLGRISSAEALVRWRHPTYGVLAPGQFLALAANPAVSHRLTDWVIACAAAQAAQWHADNLALSVAVNISPRDIEDVDLPDRVQQHCRNVAIDPGFLTLELPEPGEACEVTQIADIVTRLHLKGFKLSIEDFGRCYSPLVQSQRVPFSEVKVDLAFVKQIMSDADCRAIVEGLIDVASELGLKSAAEGVGDDDILRTLIELGCDTVQGHYISRPFAADQMPAYVHEFESHAADDGRLSEAEINAQARDTARDAADGPGLAADPDLPKLNAAE
jgi:EAL domain-containing protein (putative c-di-GMP-specific phosphodiesterase class I)